MAISQSQRKPGGPNGQYSRLTLYLRGGPTSFRNLGPIYGEGRDALLMVCSLLLISEDRGPRRRCRTCCGGVRLPGNRRESDPGSRSRGRRRSAGIGLRSRLVLFFCLQGARDSTGRCGKYAQAGWFGHPARSGISEEHRLRFSQARPTYQSRGCLLRHSRISSMA